MPYFFQGTWKVENEEIYEHWDRLNVNSLKGISYRMFEGQMSITEYLDINLDQHGIIYSAAVLHQNQGKGIQFKLIKTDSTYAFENPDHDFPKRIVYQKISDNEIFVQVSDGEKKGFAYKMRKHNEKTSQRDSTVANPNYDPFLAHNLGADNYGMKAYVLAILKTGSNQTVDKSFISNCFKGHLENITRLVDARKMVVAGPLGSNERTYRGIFILNVTDLEEAESLLQTDPAIKEGLLDVELYKWYGSAALPEYLKFSDKIWKIKP